MIILDVSELTNTDYFYWRVFNEDKSKIANV